jgi:streptomycin 6-kinase
MPPTISVPEVVRKKALASGPAGAAWLAGLQDKVDALSSRWRFTYQRALAGGSEALIAEVVTNAGSTAVLKILPPDGASYAGELRVLLAANGRGYARVHDYDADHGALLLEQLGPSLGTLGLPIDAQLAILCETLIEAWRAPADGAALTNGADKAQGLADYTSGLWDELGQPCTRHIIDRALACAMQRRRAYNPALAVIGHGDAHAWNALAADEAQRRFKFVDPDGLFIERAYDLAIPMRDWSAELLAGDALVLGIARCHRLAQLSGVPPAPIWQWGFMERVSTALLCLKVGIPGGRDMLDVSERWAVLPEADGLWG